LAFGYRIEAIIRFTKIQDAEFKRNYVAGSPDRLGGRGYSDEVLSGASRLRNYV
jgi:isocitrate lyase